MSLSKIEYEIIKNYTVTENNAIGPTTSLTLRTLDTTPTNANSIWLAPNGSDAAAGTEAAPVLTLEKAIDLLQAGAPTKTTIHIFRNGYGSSLDLEFDATDNHGSGDPFPSPSTIQVELGEIAIINFADTAIWDESGIHFHFNGLKFNYDDSGLGLRIWASGSTSTTKWCELVVDGNINNSNVTLLGTNGIVTNSILDGNNSNALWLLIVGGSNKTYGNCIFKNLPNSGGAIGIAGLNTIIEHCVFSRCATWGAVSGIDSPTIKNCVFYDTNDIYDSTISTTTLTIDNNLFSQELNVLTLQSNTTLSTSNNQSYILPLFFNQDTEDFRLMDQRRIIPGTNSTKFEFTSKAVYWPDIQQIPGDDTRDLGPYDLTITFVDETKIAHTFTNEDWNDVVTIEEIPVNLQQWESVRGNFRKSYDQMRRRIALTRNSMDWVGTQESYKFRNLLKNLTAKRWYPNGDDGIFYEPSGVATIPVSDVLLTMSSVDDLEINAHEGYIAHLSSGVAEFFLKVRENSSGTLTLFDHRENQGTIPPGIYATRLLYLPVEIEDSSMAMRFENWDPPNNPLHPQVDYTDLDSNYQNYEGHIRGLTLRETELDE